MSQGKLIVIEGVDAVWKTTLAKWLAHFYKGTYYKTPWHYHAWERAYYDQINIPIQERFQFYLRSCQRDVDAILRLQNSWKTVFCDRLFDSTIFSHKILDPSIDTTSAQVIANSIHKIQILLVAPLDTIQQRLNQRVFLTRFEKDRAFLWKMQDALQKEGKNDYIILTSQNTIHETLSKAISFLSPHVNTSTEYL